MKERPLRPMLKTPKSLASRTCGSRKGCPSIASSATFCVHQRIIGQLMLRRETGARRMRNPQSTAALNNEKRACWSGRCLLARARQQLGSELSCLQTACHGANHAGMSGSATKTNPRLHGERRASVPSNGVRSKLSLLVETLAPSSPEAPSSATPR